MSDRHIEILAEVTKISVGEIKQDLSEPDGIENRYIINTTEALTAMKRVEEEVRNEIARKFQAGLPTGDVTAWDMIQYCKKFNDSLIQLRIDAVNDSKAEVYEPKQITPPTRGWC